MDLNVLLLSGEFDLPLLPYGVSRWARQADLVDVDAPGRDE
jgi:hypothetical protein